MKSKPFSRSVGSQGEVPKSKQTHANELVISGYQGYALRRNSIDIEKPITEIKYRLIRPYIYRHLQSKSFIDIGCSSGAIGLQLALDGCGTLAFLDHDPEYTAIAAEAIKFLDMEGDFEIHTSSFSNFVGSYDVGIAFAIIHWLYSYTERYGSLSDVIAALKSIAGETLIVEWVCPSDTAIEDAGHIFKNPELHREPYSFQAFKIALDKSYKYTAFIGKTTSTREIWIGSDMPIYPDEDIYKNSTARINELEKHNTSLFMRARRKIYRAILKR